MPLRVCCEKKNRKVCAWILISRKNREFYEKKNETIGTECVIGVYLILNNSNKEALLFVRLSFHLQKN